MKAALLSKGVTRCGCSWTWSLCFSLLSHRNDSPSARLVFLQNTESILELTALRCVRRSWWMTLGLSAKFFSRARTPLTDEACDLITDLVCDVYLV